jgi:hypothetical protein
MKTTNNEKDIHHLTIGVGNVTDCGLQFTHKGGEWTEKFSWYSDKITCPDCLEIINKDK